MSNTENSSVLYSWILDLSARLSTRLYSLYAWTKSIESPYFLRFVLLTLCVFTSKGIIIFNEEVLVALAFVLFLDSFIYGFRDSIQEALDERSRAIHTELISTYAVKKRLLGEKAKDLHKIYTGEGSVFIVDLVRQCGESTKASLRQLEIAQNVSFFVKSKVSRQLSKSLSFLHRNMNPDVQADLARHFVCVSYYRAISTSKSIKS